MRALRILRRVRAGTHLIRLASSNAVNLHANSQKRCVPARTLQKKAQLQHERFPAVQSEDSEESVRRADQLSPLNSESRTSLNCLLLNPMATATVAQIFFSTSAKSPSTAISVIICCNSSNAVLVFLRVAQILPDRSQPRRAPFQTLRSGSPGPLRAPPENAHFFLREPAIRCRQKHEIIKTVQTRSIRSFSNDCELDSVQLSPSQARSCLSNEVRRITADLLAVEDVNQP